MELADFLPKPHFTFRLSLLSYIQTFLTQLHLPSTHLHCVWLENMNFMLQSDTDDNDI